MNQPVPPAPTPLNMRVSPENRAKFTGFLEGVRSKAVTSQMPPPMPMQPGMMPQGQAMGMPPMPPQGMMPPMQPPMMPPRPPMPMNMGGMVDVFDPRYMNEGGFVISTDDSGKIRTRPVFDEDRGRMVSQILSRDMVDDMANKAAMLKTRQSPPMEVEPESKLVAIKEMLEDDYESGKGFAETMQPVTTKPTISLPTPKPNLPMDIDMLRVGEDTDTSISLPKRKPIQLPVSKPKSILSADFTDTPNYERFKADYTDIPNYRRGDLEDMIRDIDDLGTEDRSLDPSTAADLILGRGDAVFDTPIFGNLSRNVRVTRDAPEGDFSFSSDVPVEKLADLYKENTLEDVLARQEDEQGLSLLAKILNLFRPQFTTESAGFEEIGGGEKFPPSTALRSDIFNNGGIVQGFSNGGFTTNLRAAEPERAREIEEARYLEDLVGEYDKMYREPRDSDDLGSATPIFKTTSTPRDTSDDDLRRDEDQVESTGPVYDAFLKSQESPFAPIVNKIGESVFNKSPYDLFYTTQQNLKPDSMQSRIARDRQLDRERAERKLAEEQRMRDMIQGMLPPTAATAPTAPIADAPTADPATPDYGSVVVPSDRVPGFDVGNISPYPQFRMPTEFEPIFPTSLSANYFKDLFKNIGVQNMQQGGSVNQLDSAIDNFINAYR